MEKIKDFMTQDHYRLDRIFRDFLKVRDKDREQALNLFQEFKVGLLKHMAWEEDLLFPMIERRTGMNMPGPSTLVRIQHQQIKALIEKVSGQIVSKESGPVEFENEVIDVLTLHSQEEEKVLYPWIDISLGEKEREEALNKMNSPPEKESGK